MSDQAESVEILIAKLVDAINDLGLSAESFGASMVWAVNRGADPPPGGVRMSPGLRQVVQCRADDLGRLGWFWVWSSPGETPEHEWFAPAERIDEAAEKIANVLALRPEAVSVDGSA